MSELLRKAVETMKLLKKKPHLKPVAVGGGELSKAERWRTAQMAQDWLNANADPKYHRRRLPDMEENGQFKLLTRGRLGMERFFSAFSNWRTPGIRQLLKEYKIEGEMKGNSFWKSKRDFIDAMRSAKVEQITPDADAAISYRSRTPDKKSLLGLIKGYRSYPKYRNEGTLNAIYDGYKANTPMDRPIVVDFGKGKRRVFSGNTRMDAAFHSGISPEVLVVNAQKNFSRHEFAMVKPVKVSKFADPETRRKFAKSLRRKLEKLASGKEERLAVRSALGARPAKHQITTTSDAALATKLGYPTKPGYIHPQSTPQIVKVDGELALLAFRGAKKGGTPPELSRILSRPRAGRFTTSPNHPTVAEARQQSGGFKGHVEQPQGAYLSLSTNKNMPKQEGWMGPNDQGESALGVYATKIKKFLKRFAGKEKIGIVNDKFPQEHEITQKSGGNLISVRKFKGGDPGYHYPGEQRAFSRLYEFRSYDKTGEEERRDLLKAGIVGTGLAAAGGLAGLGLYKAGVSGAAQKLARLSKAVKKAGANKAAGVRQAKAASAQAAAAATKQRDAAQEARKFFIDDAGKFYGKSKAAKVSAPKPAPARPSTEVTTQIPEGVVNTQAAVVPAPTPPPAATTTKAPAATKAPVKVPVTTKAPVKVPATTKAPVKAKSQTPAEAADVLEKQNKQAQAADVAPETPPVGTSSKKLQNSLSNVQRMRGKSNASAAAATENVGDMGVAEIIKSARNLRQKNASTAVPAPKTPKAKNATNATKPATKTAKAKELQHEKYKGHKIFTDPGYIAKWGGIEEQKRIIDEATDFSRAGALRYFNQLQTDEGGIPLTGRVPRDRFVKKLRDEDLDRRDANILRAGGAGALAGLMARGRIGAGKRALIGAGIGGLGVLGIRQITNNDRDIYGERNRGSKRAELIPALGGLGVAAWLAGKRFKAFAKKIDHRVLAARLRGVKEFGSMGAGRLYRQKAALLKRGLFIEKRNRVTGGLLSTETRPLVSDRGRYAGIYHRLAKKGAGSPNLPPWKQDVAVGAKLQSPYDGKMQHALKYDDVMQKHERKMRGFSSRLRGLKEFDDYRLYYFKGRNTGIAAKSVEEARSKKKRGGDELVAVRTPSDSEKSQMARGVWVRTRRDGKSPDQSRYGKGRGQGPARKSLSAKLRGVKEFGSMGLQKLYRKQAALVREGLMTGGRDRRGVLGAATSKLIEQHPKLEWKRGAAIDRWLKWKNSPPMPGSIWASASNSNDLHKTVPADVLARNMPLILLSARYRAVKFFEKRDRREKRELNPYVGAALSGGVSGASLGALSWLKRGTSAASAGKMAAKLGALSAGVVGGGAMIGSRIVGDPRKEEGAPFMKRVALGGAITGALVGGTGGLLLRNTKLVREAAKTWRPAKWIIDSPALGAGALGAAGGAVVGAAQGADEGQQVDSIRNLRKDIKQKNFSRLMEFRAFPALAAKQVWKTDPALRADFAKRIVAKVKGAVAANKKQYGVKEFQVSPLNVEPMAQTKERRSIERARFLKTTGIIAGLGLAGLGGYGLARVLGKAELRAAKSSVKAAQTETEWMKGRAEKYQGYWKDEASDRARDNARASARAQERRQSENQKDKKYWEEWHREDNRKWEEDLRKRWGMGGNSAGRSYDDDYVRRSQQARQQSRPSGAGSNSGASSNSGAQGVKNPYAGTPKAEAWEKWHSMDRMAKESPHEGERINAAEARDKWKKRHNLARKLRSLKMFGRDDQPRYRESKAWADPVMGWIRGDDLVDKDGNKWSPSSPQLVNAMHNKARGIRVKVQRGAGLAGDTTAVLQGKDRERDASGRIKKREWEKAWFRNAVTTAGLTVAGLAGAGAWRYGRMNPGTTLGKFVTNTESGVRKTKDDLKRGLGGLMRGADDITGKSKFIRKLLSAKLRLREFDLFASAAGWDARDPRGRSVRVYAPGSRTRVRREKYWHEKTENQRKLMIAAGVGAAAIGGLGGVAAYRLAKGKSLVPSFMLKKPPVPMDAPQAPPVPVMVRRQDGKFAPNAKNPVTGKKERPYADRPYVQSEEEKRKLRDYFAGGGAGDAA